MNRLLLLLLIFSPIGLFAQLSTNEITQFRIGMKKSEVEKILQKNAIRKGVSFSLENYRTNAFHQLDMPEETQLDEQSTEVYIIDKNQVVFDNGLLSIFSLRTEETEDKEQLQHTLIDRYGTSLSQGKRLDYWLTDSCFVIAEYGNNKIIVNALRKDLFPLHYLNRFKEEDENYVLSEEEDSSDIMDLGFSSAILLKLDKDLTEIELTNIVLEHYKLGDLANLDKYKQESRPKDGFKEELDLNKLIRYELGENTLFFYNGKYAGGRVRTENISEEDLNKLREHFNTKYGSAKAEIENEGATLWMNDDMIIILQERDDRAIKLVAASLKYLSAETVSEMRQSFDLE